MSNTSKLRNKRVLVTGGAGFIGSEVVRQLHSLGAKIIVFDNFSGDVFHGKDRSTSSKEAMLKALDVQNNANKNMIDLAKVLAGKNDKGTNILVQAITEKQAGISINNIRDNL